METVSETQTQPAVVAAPVLSKPIELSPEPSVEKAKPTVQRFAFVDGLRGLAALAIVIFHIRWYELEPRAAVSDAMWIIDAALLRARGGVQILLVISGFVIAYTLR